MKNSLIKYKLNIEEYKKMYEFFNVYIARYIHDKRKKYKIVNEIIGIYFAFEDLVNGYINHTEKDHLFKLYTNGMRNFYICVGNLPMYDRNDKKYGDYFLVVNFIFNDRYDDIKIKGIKEYLRIEDFVNKYIEVEDEEVLNTFNNISIFRSR